MNCIEWKGARNSIGNRDSLSEHSLNQRKYPEWSVIRQYLRYENKRLFFKRTDRPVHSKTVAIEGVILRTTHIIHMFEHGVWPVYRPVNNRTKSNTFSIVLRPEEKSRLIAYAQANNVSLCTVVRAALNQYLLRKANARTQPKTDTPMHREQFDAGAK